MFNQIDSLPLERQTVEVDARMSYRKRGLVYFSGFELWLAYAVSSLVVVGLLVGAFLGVTLNRRAGRHAAVLLAAFLFVPTLAVVLQGHTGLIYTIEVLGLLVTTMVLTTRTWFRGLIDQLAAPEAAPAGSG